MKSLQRLFCLGSILTALFFAACSSSQEGASAKKAEARMANEGDVFYTQINMRFENKTHITTNYQVGILVPVNTEVLFKDYNSKNIVFNLKDGSRLKIENVEEYSGENIAGIFNRVFGKTKVDLSKFSKAENEGIAGATAETGMSKEAVILAIGYPPKHKTPSFASNAWRYWHNRFDTFTVHFKDGKVANIEE